MRNFSIATASALLLIMTVASFIAPAAAPLYAAPAPAGGGGEEASGLACAACAGIFLVIPLIYIVLSLIIGVWMYRDAQRRANPQAVLWLIVGIIFNIVGLMIYFAVRKSGSQPPRV